MPFVAGAAALVGVVSGVLMQWWMNDVDYAVNVGNRNVVPSPTWMPVTFELGVLLAGIAIFFGLMALFRFPRPYDPLFEVEAFRSGHHRRPLAVGVGEGRAGVRRLRRAPPPRRRRGRAGPGGSMRALPILALALVTAGCEWVNPMLQQPKVKPYRKSVFYPDQIGMRAPPPGRSRPAPRSRSPPPPAATPTGRRWPASRCR